MNCGQTDPSQRAETPSLRKFSDMTQILPEKHTQPQVGGLGMAADTGQQ